MHPSTAQATVGRPRPPVPPRADQASRSQQSSGGVGPAAPLAVRLVPVRLNPVATIAELACPGLASSSRTSGAAVDAWRTEYNADRPHQSLAMAFPIARFTPATGRALGLRVPASLAPADPPSQSPAPPVLVSR